MSHKEWELRVKIGLIIGLLVTFAVMITLFESVPDTAVGRQGFWVGVVSGGTIAWLLRRFWAGPEPDKFQ